MAFLMPYAYAYAYAYVGAYFDVQRASYVPFIFHGREMSVSAEAEKVQNPAHTSTGAPFSTI